MFLRIETSSGVPITRQLVDQIRSHAITGTLAPGDRLPSVRQLAKELAVNPNTILHVYERLTDEGLLERRQGDGTYLSQSARSGGAKAQKQMLADAVDRLAHRAADLSVSRQEVDDLLNEAFIRVEHERATSQKGRAT